MNNYRLFLLLLLSGLSQLTYAQKKMLFKVALAPNKTYKTTMTNLTDMEMMVKGDSAMIAQITAGGMKLPVMMQMNQNVATTTKTGTARADKKIPLTITYDNLSITQSVNGQENTQNANPFANAVIEGTTIGDGKITIDTIKGVSDEALKAALRQMVNGIQASIRFPENELKIGDSFDQEVPMNLPIPQADMKMTLLTKYTLKEINGNKAIFDLKQNITMDMSIQDANKGKGVGTGTGAMVFDIDKKMAEQSNSDIQFQFEFGISGMTMSANCRAKTNVKIDME